LLAADGQPQQAAASVLGIDIRFHQACDGGIAYLRPGPFYNTEAKTGAEEWDVSGFRGFIDHAFEGFLQGGASRLIIDLRGNPGGDNLFSDVMVSWFADRPFRFASQFKIKVSAESIAANAARIVHDAEAAGPVSRQFADIYARSRIGDVVDFAIGAIVGEATSDMATTYGAMEQFAHRHPRAHRPAATEV
jgi:hypothetical protein